MNLCSRARAQAKDAAGIACACVGVVVVSHVSPLVGRMAQSVMDPLDYKLMRLQMFRWMLRMARPRTQDLRTDD